MNDAELISQVRNGNSGAFRYLIDKYQALVWHLVLRMVKNKEMAEDISQEVFLRVYRDISKFRGESKLSTWIGSITYNVTIDNLRKKGKEPVDFGNKISADEFSYAGGDNPLESLNRSGVIKLVHQIIEKLPFHYRTVITLFYLEEFSYAEIKEITSMPEGTIKSYLGRGRILIYKIIEDKVPELKEDFFKEF